MTCLRGWSGVRDLFGDGKTAVKASLSQLRGGAVGCDRRRQQPAEHVGQQRIPHVWTDANRRHWVPDCDLRNTLRNGNAVRSTTSPSGSPTRRLPAMRMTCCTGTARVRIAGNSQPGFSASQPSFAVTGAYLRRWHGNFSVTDNVARRRRRISRRTHHRAGESEPAGRRRPPGLRLYDTNKFGVILERHHAGEELRQPVRTCA